MIEISITTDELRIDPLKYLEMQSIYANADLGGLAQNQIGGYIRLGVLLFYYSALPEGVCCEAHLRMYMAATLRKVFAPICSNIQ